MKYVRNNLTVFFCSLERFTAIYNETISVEGSLANWLLPNISFYYFFLEILTPDEVMTRYHSLIRLKYSRHGPTIK